MTVFLLGTIPFPEGYGAGVHFAWPGGDYIPLGYLSNDKPSAIFRLRSSSPSSLVPIHNHQAACIGIELIHLSQLRIMIESSEEDKAKGKEVAARTDVGLVAEKVVKNSRNTNPTISVRKVVL
ncbi:hypothetical protein M231_00846 [Tremella mesenterica]|uniref:Hikeshi-like N-terminal domain-containing protein n=1 Tax=Tremella mesenterica TaxID=5217 RepID=A0A4V1M4X1_TREME|nr:hypothetical protein M231_00846 [Tremella mesenterica]